jgi:hypothetical protein
MSTHVARWLALVAMGLATAPASAQVAGTLTGEIALGYFLAGDDLGATHPIDPAGVSEPRRRRSGDVPGYRRAPAPDPGGLRPFTRLSSAHAANVPAVRVPCDPDRRARAS